MSIAVNSEGLTTKGGGDFVLVGDRAIPLAFVRHPRARRYVLRLRPDGVARVTIPRGGSELAARQFVARHGAWLERQLGKLAARPVRPAIWLAGTEILLRGESVRLEGGSPETPGVIQFAGEALRINDPAGDLRPFVERHLWRLAARELPPRVIELAALHNLTVQRVTVRNQKSRWGSCSRRGTISLNWRLIQTPAFVRNYIILHELMHLRQMNHSPRFWREVARVFPDYEMAERWLKDHAALIK